MLFVQEILTITVWVLKNPKLINSTNKHLTPDMGAEVVLILLVEL